MTRLSPNQRGKLAKLLAEFEIAPDLKLSSWVMAYFEPDGFPTADEQEQAAQSAKDTLVRLMTDIEAALQ